MDDDGDSDWNSDWDLGEPTQPSSPKTIHFAFGSRKVTATGAQTDRAHPNVLRLRIHHSILQLAVQTLLRWLPSSLRSCVHSSCPEWFLPTDVVLKRQKDGWDVEFDAEKAAYEKLRCLQGLVIPVCYGQVQHEGTRALLLSDIGGACVAEPEGAVLSEQDIRPLFDQALGALASQGISHDDVKLDNFHLVDKGGNKAVMVLDLERVSELPAGTDRAWIVQTDVDFLMQAYRDHLECLREDGLLLPRVNVSRRDGAR